MDPSDVTPEWLTDRLRSSGAAPDGGSITSFTAEAIGEGKVGRTFRFALEWDGPRGPDTVVGKFASDDEQSRMAGLLTGTYVREINFFHDLADQVDIRMPTCHHAELDVTTGDFAILMADLAPAEVGDQITGCSVDDARAALAELVGLHAPDLAGLESTEWLVAKRPEGAEAMGGLYLALLPTFVERYTDRLPDETMATAQRFGECVHRWLTLAAPPYRLLHGDYRLDNLMFGPQGVVAVDWQTVGHGPPVSDVAYFCGASLLTDDRRTHEEALVREYHDMLEERTGGLITWDRCWADYRLHAVAGLHMAVVASALVTEDERGDAMFCVMAERHAAHMTDFDTLALLEA
ncbi:MAG: phosphotransferase family protein [Acidimicrobiales bacterium]